MPDDVVEALVLGPQGEVISQVPFAEHAGAVAICLERLGQCHFPVIHQGSAHDRVPDPRPIRIASRHQGRARRPDPRPIRIASRHQGRARRRTGRIDVKVSQSHALRPQLVHMWRPDHRVAMGTHLPIALVIRDNQNNIGSGGRGRLGTEKSRANQPRRAHPGTAYECSTC